jgi:hypothetical protein
MEIRIREMVTRLGHGRSSLAQAPSITFRRSTSVVNSIYPLQVCCAHSTLGTPYSERRRHKHCCHHHIKFYNGAIRTPNPLALPPPPPRTSHSLDHDSLSNSTPKTLRTFNAPKTTPRHRHKVFCENTITDSTGRAIRTICTGATHIHHAD